jgi:hypothetical protein
MTLTVNSSATPYLTVAEFLKRCDVRTVGDLCSDTGARITAAALATDPNLAAAVFDASGIFEAAATMGQRYQPVDLQALIASPCAGQALIYRLLSDYTTVLLWERRPDLGKTPERLLWTEEFLQKLSAGDRVLPFLETQKAGLLAADQESPIDVINRNLTTNEAYRLYGPRNNKSWQQPGQATTGS